MRLYATFTPFRKGRAFIILRSAVMGLSESRRPYEQAGRRMYLSFRFYCRVFLGGKPPPASILSVYASKSSLPGDCHVANACPARSIATSPLLLKTVTCGLFLRHFVPPRRAHNDKALRLFAWFIIRVRSSSFLSRVISRLMPLNDDRIRSLLSLPPSGEGFTSTWSLMSFRSPYRFIPANTTPRRLSGRSLRGL